MRGFDERSEIRRVKRVIYSPFFIVLLMAATVFAVRGVYRMALKAHHAKMLYVNTQQEYEVLKRREQYLQARIAELQTEKGIEARIREKFGYVKPGEEMVVIVDENKKKVENTESSHDAGILGTVLRVLRLRD